MASNQFSDLPIGKRASYVEANKSFIYTPLIAQTNSHSVQIDPIAFDCVKLIVIRDGSAVLVSEIGTRHGNVGDVVLLAARTRCGAEPEGSVTATTIYIDCDFVIDQIFWQYSAQLGARCSARELFNSIWTTPAQILRVGEGMICELKPWLDELSELCVNGVEPSRYLRAQTLLFSVLDAIAPFISIAEQPASISIANVRSPTAPRHRQFKPIRIEAQLGAQLLHSDPARRWNVSQLAEAVHLSPSQFRRVFIEAFGKSPITYLTILRIERMQQLLRSTTLSIKQVARQVGWSDPDFAVRQFRRGTGVSPRDYRRLPWTSIPNDVE